MDEIVLSGFKALVQAIKVTTRVLALDSVCTVEHQTATVNPS
jgi:hypothetical protein